MQRNQERSQDSNRSDRSSQRNRRANDAAAHNDNRNPYSQAARDTPPSSQQYSLWSNDERREYRNWVVNYNLHGLQANHERLIEQMEQERENRRIDMMRYEHYRQEEEANQQPWFGEMNDNSTQPSNRSSIPTISSESSSQADQGYSTQRQTRSQEDHRPGAGRGNRGHEYP